MMRMRVVATLMLAAASAGCGGANTAPSPTAVATFRVGDEPFQVLLTNAQQIAAARLMQAGGAARIPNGRLAAGTQVNTGWSWHLEDIAFAETTIELCDGRPSDVERQGTAFGGGRYCPWRATIVAIDEGAR